MKVQNLRKLLSQAERPATGPNLPGKLLNAEATQILKRICRNSGRGQVTRCMCDICVSDEKKQDDIKKYRVSGLLFVCPVCASESKRLLMKSRCVGRPQLAAAADRPLLSSWVCWSLAASHRLAWQHIEHGDDRWRAALRPVAGSCGRRAPEGLMDSKDLLVLAASVMRSIR